MASANAVPLDALYGMLGVLGVDTASGNIAEQLSQGAARLKTIMETRHVQERQDPEIVRLASLADRAEEEGTIALALQFRARASTRADEIGRRSTRPRPTSPGAGWNSPRPIAAMPRPRR